MKQPVAKLLVPLAAAAILFRVAAQASGADASVPQTSVHDLVQLAEHGDAAKATASITELRRRAATGDVTAVNALDYFLSIRAANGDDAAVTELLARAKADEKTAKAGLRSGLYTAAVKGSHAALAELRRQADHEDPNGPLAAESAFDGVLEERAVAGDMAALAELRRRAATGSQAAKSSKKQLLDEALEKLAGLGNVAVLAELRAAAENGDRSAQYSLGQIYYHGTSAIKRDITTAARVQGCPIPDETIMQGCHGVEVSALPKPVTMLMRKLKCDDDYPEPVAIDLDHSGTPQYKLCCNEPSHGPCDAVVIGRVRGQWRALSEPYETSGYYDNCEAFFPLTTTHGGFHDICLSNECILPSANGHSACAKPILEFNGGRYLRK